MDGIDPLGVLQIPGDGLQQPAGERLARLPAQLALDLGDIHGITTVMAGAVGHILDERGLRRMWRLGQARPDLTDTRDHGQVGGLVTTANIIALARLAVTHNGPDGLAMVFNIQPVADLLSIAIHRQRAALQSIQDHQRDEFFRKLVGAVVVGAVGDGERQPVGMAVSPHQVVAGGLWAA